MLASNIYWKKKMSMVWLMPFSSCMFLSRCLGNKVHFFFLLELLLLVHKDQMEPWTLKELLRLFVVSQYLAVTKVLPVVLEVIVLFAALSAYAVSCVVFLQLPTWANGGELCSAWASPRRTASEWEAVSSEKCSFFLLNVGNLDLRIFLHSQSRNFQRMLFWLAY